MAEKKYKLGYFATIQVPALGNYEQIRTYAQQCERFVVGIPSDYVMARLFGADCGYRAESAQSFWRDIRFVSDVLVLDADALGYQAVHEKIPFDVCFYASEYGLPFRADKQFMDERNISFVPIIPERRLVGGRGDALRIALENVQRNQKIILFGTGAYFDAYMRDYGARYAPAYAVDNSPEKWNTRKAGILIQRPEVLQNENAADVLVVLCGKNYNDMLAQLTQLGNFNYRTLLYENGTALLEEFAIAYAAEQAYIQKAQATLMVLLKEFDRVCTKYGLKYYVICGSLIGVVRHKGFIPWDDDLDVAMPRDDLNKLKEIAATEWDKEEFFLLNHDNLGNGAFLDFMPRLLYMKERFPTKVYDKVEGKADPKLTHRAFLDIYPMDNASKSQKKHDWNILLMRFVYNLCMGHRGTLNYADYARLPKYQVAIIKFVNSVGRCLPEKLIASWYDRLSQYARNERCDDYFMPSCSVMCIERRFAKRFFGDGVRMPMNDMDVLVPADYDGLLNSMGYRGYMNFPPLSVRKPSHYFNSDIEIW